MKLSEIFGKFPFSISIKRNKTKAKGKYKGTAMAATRSTIPTVDTFAPDNRLIEIPPDFAVEWLSTLENLAAYNHDVSYALDNIVQLANTEHVIEFAEDVPDDLQKEIMNMISDEQDKWYNNSEGIRSFKSDILAQGAINGAISVEIIPDLINATIDQVVRIPPKYIRFVYDRKIDRYLPYQVIKTLFIQGQSQTGLSHLKRLNTKTYKYVAWRRLFEGPYPTPPFISAIEGLIIQKDMLGNFAEIMKKLGMLGFLSAKVEPPEQEEGEGDTAYFERCKTYLQDVVYPQLDKNLSSGVVAGFKDSHEFELVGNKMNVTGAEGLIKIIDLIIFAGLKQDPNMLGRNFSTTETFGRVILSKMLNQVRDWQKMSDRIFKEMYQMFVMLKGYDPDIIKDVVSEAPMVVDREKEERAEQTKIGNVKSKRNMGIIDQQQAAIELGYDTPAEEDWQGMYGYAEEPGQDPKNQAPEGEEGTKTDPANDPTTDEERRQAISGYEIKLRKGIDEYQYETENCHGVHTHNFIAPQDFHDDETNRLAKNYFNATMKNYRRSLTKISKSVGKSFETMDENTPLHVIQDEVYLKILTEFDNEFVPRQQRISENNVDKIFSHFRKDKSIFGVDENGFSKQQFADDFIIPEAIFDLDDFRTIEYLAQSDAMYLGKFITDQSTKKKVYQYIEQQYIKGYLPFGAEPKVIKQFQNKFEKFLELEAWKIRRVIDTSISNSRNDANVLYMSQAQVDEYEISEIVDKLTCDWCRRMNGVKYSVSTAKTKISNKVNVGPENVNRVSPFATSIPLDEFEGLTDTQISNRGITTPAYHPSCRGRIIAVI